MADRPSPSEALLVQRRLPVPPAKVFDAFTDPKRLARWFAPSATMRTVVHELDPRPGGAWRLDMIEGENVLRLGGVYQAVERPRLLLFTWRWEGSPEETLVRIELADAKGGCELMLTHERFLTQASKEEHGRGWEACFDRLPEAWGP